MRFDDSLTTVLRGEVSTAIGTRAAFRQIADLVGRRRVAPDPELLRRLRTLRDTVPASVRRNVAQGLALVDPPAALVAFFAEDEPPIAATILRAARLQSEEWEALLPRLTPEARGVLRRRVDLPPTLAHALAGFDHGGVMPGDDRAIAVAVTAGAADASSPVTAGANGDMLANLVQQLERQQSGPSALSGDTARVLAFRFETDTGGIVQWVDTAPRGALVGLSISHDSGDAAMHVDRVASGAFRKRSPFADARLVVPGDSAVSGDWRISGTPVFDRVTGSFIGFRGRARRPRVEEDAAGTRILRDGAGSEGLRRLMHELRTPTNAIAGFSELIEQELLGQVQPVHRDRAAGIRRHVVRLISAIDDLDLAARIDGEALDLRADTISLAPLMARVASDLAPLAALRGSGITWPHAMEGAWMADAHAAERLLARLTASLLSATRPGETLRITLDRRDGDMLPLAIHRPAAFIGCDEAALFAMGDDPADAGEDMPLLGTGFALRLARRLARELGGRLTFAPDRLILALPAASSIQDASTGLVP